MSLEPAASLRDCRSNSSDLMHPDIEVLGWLRTACYRQDNKRVRKQLWACVKAERLLFEHVL